MHTAKSLSRRHFLKRTAAATAAPFILPSHIWSAETKPNDRITMGFVGLGKQNRGLLGDFVKRKETQVLAVCEVDTTRRNSAKKIIEDYYAKQTDRGAYKGCDTYVDFRQLVERKDIDAVCIATPDHWHAIIAIAAANAGKDIYCEKPMSETIREARAMVNAVRKNKRIFQTGSMQRASREFRTACELVRNGVIGKITTVHAAVSGPGKPCDLPEEAVEPGLDWNMWLGPAPMRPYNSVLSPRGVHDHFPLWRNYREYGGGGVTDWGAHHFDIAQWGLGMDDSGPVEIVPPKDWETAQSGVKMVYANGVELFHDSGNGVTFTGADGEIYVNRGKFKLTLKGAEKAKFMGKEDKPSLAEQLAQADKEFLTDAKIRLYKSDDHKGDFLGAIRSRKDPLAKVEIGAHSVMVCHLCNLAYYHGQTLKWNPAKEEFAGKTGDAKWLTREYRDPWKVA